MTRGHSAIAGERSAQADWKTNNGVKPAGFHAISFGIELASR